MKSYVSWVGFSEEGMLSTMDDNGVLSGFNYYTQQWVPVLDLKKRFTESFRNFWVVGILEHELLGIEMQSGLIQPPL